MEKTYDYDKVMDHCKGALNDACSKLQADLKTLHEQIKELETHYHGKDAGSTVRKRYTRLYGLLGGMIPGAPASAGSGLWYTCRNSADLITTMFYYAELDKQKDQAATAQGAVRF